MIKNVVFFLGKNNTVAAILSINYDDHDRWLTLKSESKRETLTIYTNYNFKLRTREFFIENSCDVGKIQKDTHIEYKATVRNCAGSETLSKYFLALIRDKWGNQLELSSRGNKTEVKKSFVELHKYINPHYTSDDNDIYYAFVNYPTMEADDISLELLSFDLETKEYHYDGLYGEEIIALEHAWCYDLEIQYRI